MGTPSTKYLPVHHCRLGIFLEKKINEIREDITKRRFEIKIRKEVHSFAIIQYTIYYSGQNQIHKTIKRKE